MKSQRQHSVPNSAYDEQRVAFDQVLRKLVNTKPVHKTTAGLVKRNADKPGKQV